jgi:hypothetical protein
MQHLIEAFAKVDLKQEEKAFQSWIEKKNKSVEKLKFHSRSVDIQQTMNTYDQWLLMKSIQAKQLQLEQDRMNETKKYHQKLDRELQEINKQKQQEAYLLWLETKKIEKIQKELVKVSKQDPVKVEIKQPKKLKKMVLIRAKHPKEWVSVIENPAEEPEDEPLKREMKKEKPLQRSSKLPSKRMPTDNFKKKYHCHVATGF